jgi:hypothetical protein
MWWFISVDSKPETVAAATSDPSVSTNLVNPFTMARQVKLPPQKQKTITYRIAKHIVADMKPINTVESTDFRAMIHECEPRYVFPIRATVSETIIPKMYDRVAKRIRDEIKDQTLAWTTDSWTSRATQSYVTITCHFIDESFKMNSCVLQTREMPDSHTGENIAIELENASDEWGCKATAISTDNAANMKVAIRRTTIPIHMGCFAHTLNLAANKAVELKEVSSALGRI